MYHLQCAESSQPHIGLIVRHVSAVCVVKPLTDTPLMTHAFHLEFMRISLEQATCTHGHATGTLLMQVGLTPHASHLNVNRYGISWNVERHPWPCTHGRATGTYCWVRG